MSPLLTVRNFSVAAFDTILTACLVCGVEMIKVAESASREEIAFTTMELAQSKASVFVQATTPGRTARYSNPRSLALLLLLSRPR